MVYLFLKILSLELQCRHKWFVYNLIKYLAMCWCKANKNISNQTFIINKIRPNTLFYSAAK